MDWIPCQGTKISHMPCSMVRTIYIFLIGKKRRSEIRLCYSQVVWLWVSYFATLNLIRVLFLLLWQVVKSVLEVLFILVKIYVVSHHLEAGLQCPDEVSTLQSAFISTWLPSSLFHPQIHTHTRQLHMMCMHTYCCCCLVTKSCLTLCDRMDYSPPDSSVHGISQARILEWLAISFSRGSSRSSVKLASPALQADSLPLSHLGSSHTCFKYVFFIYSPHNQTFLLFWKPVIFLQPRNFPRISKLFP